MRKNRPLTEIYVLKLRRSLRHAKIAVDALEKGLAIEADETGEELPGPAPKAVVVVDPDRAAAMSEAYAAAAEKGVPRDEFAEICRTVHGSQTAKKDDLTCAHWRSVEREIAARPDPPPPAEITRVAVEEKAAKTDIFLGEDGRYLGEVFARWARSVLRVESLEGIEASAWAKLNSDLDQLASAAGSG